MLISINRRLVFLSMPKCGSTAIAAALAPHFGATFTAPPALKHMPFPTFSERLRPFLARYAEGGAFETVCLFREPLDWRRSWWRYRMRERAAKRGRSTGGMSFGEFLEANLAGADGPAKTGSQARFVSDRAGDVAVDRIWRYENIAACHAYLCERLGVTVPLGRENASPDRASVGAASDETPDAALTARAEATLAREFEIHAKIAL